MTAHYYAQRLSAPSIPSRPNPTGRRRPLFLCFYRQDKRQTDRHKHKTRHKKRSVRLSLRLHQQERRKAVGCCFLLSDGENVPTMNDTLTCSCSLSLSLRLIYAQTRWASAQEGEKRRYCITNEAAPSSFYFILFFFLKKKILGVILPSRVLCYV